MRTGPPPDPDVPLVVQVSRWDRLKDMPGVMQGFADFVVSDHETQLVLAGPVVSAVSDDPEGAEVLAECWEAWRRLPHHARSRVALACLPMADLEENAVIVNALQRHAAIVVQKSLAEGFGLTVSEAMFKRRPVVASAVGGIADQITDGESGILLRDPPTCLPSPARSPISWPIRPAVRRSEKRHEPGSSIDSCPTASWPVGAPWSRPCSARGTEPAGVVTA